MLVSISRGRASSVIVPTPPTGRLYPETTNNGFAANVSAIGKLWCDSERRLMGTCVFKCHENEPIWSDENPHVSRSSPCLMQNLLVGFSFLCQHSEKTIGLFSITIIADIRVNYSRPCDVVLEVNALYWSIINNFEDNIKTGMKPELKNYVWSHPWRSLLHDEIRSVHNYD